MTLKHLRIFVAVYQEMNITRAAENLHMTQPAVTRSVQELESHYGIRLFERINHRLYQTKNGADFYARALHILESFDDLEREFHDRDEFGSLRIGASITLGSFLLPKVIGQFQEAHPTMQVKATVSNTGIIQQAILNNTLDLAMVESSTSSEYISSKLLTKDHMQVIVPPQHPLLLQPTVTLKALSAYPLLLREKGSAARIFLEHVFAVHGLTLSPVWESASTQALINAAAAGLGISILPEKLVQAALADGLVRSLSLQDEAFLRENYIIWHRQKYLTAAAKEFIALCEKESPAPQDCLL